MTSPSDIFKILSADTRIEIIEILKSGPMCVCAIAERLGVTQSAISQHLRLLKAAGLVRSVRQGYWIHYELNPDALKCCCQEVERVCKCGCQKGAPKKRCK